MSVQAKVEKHFTDSFHKYESKWELDNDDLLEMFTKILEKKSNPVDQSDVVHLCLKYLCITGNLEDFVKFIESDYDIYEIINRIDIDGNMLHTALYWNSGEKGRKFFDIFYAQGSKICVNDKNELPWEQKGDTWIYVGPDSETKNIGVRDYKEFDVLYNIIKTQIQDAKIFLLNLCNSFETK